MLTSLLVWVVLLGSLGTFLIKFFLPELYQKNDLIWSGVGLFYGLMLALYASEIRGGLLLGQTTGVAMLVWFGWQTYKLRYEALPESQRSSHPMFTTIKGWLSRLNIPLFKDQGLKDQTQAVLDKLQNQPAAQTTSEPKAELSAPPETAADMTVEIPAVAVGIPTEIASAEKLIAKLDPVELVPEPEPEPETKEPETHEPEPVLADSPAPAEPEPAPVEAQEAQTVEVQAEIVIPEAPIAPETEQPPPEAKSSDKLTAQTEPEPQIEPEPEISSELEPEPEPEPEPEAELEAEPLWANSPPLGAQYMPGLAPLADTFNQDAPPKASGARPAVSKETHSEPEPDIPEEAPPEENWPPPGTGL